MVLGYRQGNYEANRDAGASVRLLYTFLVGLGAALTAFAVIWWAVFYQSIIQGTPYRLQDALPCLYSSAGVCSSIIAISQLAGRSPYTPEVLWFGIGLIFASVLVSAMRPRRD